MPDSLRNLILNENDRWITGVCESPLSELAFRTITDRYMQSLEPKAQWNLSFRVGGLSKKEHTQKNPLSGNEKPNQTLPLTRI